jgi:hypothetical protein
MFAVAAVVAYLVGPEVYYELGQGVAAGIVAGAAAATAGSVASQTVGIAIGEQSSFNWSEVASAAIAGAVGGGLLYGEPTAFATSTEGEILNAAADSAVGQETNIAFGLQKSFSWEAVAAAAVAAPIAQSLGGQVARGTNDTLGAFGSKLLAGLAAGGIDQAAYAAFTGGKINYAQLVGDSFGNAIGDDIAAHLKPSATTPTSASSTAASSAQNGSTQSSSSATTATAQGGSANETTETGTKNKNPFSNLTLPVIQPSSFVSFNPNDISLPDISLGDLNIPAAAASPGTSALASDAFTQYWNDSVAQLIGGPSPSFAAGFNQMLATSQADASNGYTIPADFGLTNPNAGWDDTGRWSVYHLHAVGKIMPSEKRLPRSRA